VIIELDDGRAFLSFLRMQGHWFARQKSELRPGFLEKLGRNVSGTTPTRPSSSKPKAASAVLTNAALAVLASARKNRTARVQLGPTC